MHSSLIPLYWYFHLKYKKSTQEHTPPNLFPFKLQAPLCLLLIFPASFTHSNSFFLLHTTVEIFYLCVFHIKKDTFLNITYLFDKL